MAGALLLALTAAGCFTDHINTPPQVSITGPIGGPLWRRQPAQFKATVNDPDGDAWTLGWQILPHDDCSSGIQPPVNEWTTNADTNIVVANGVTDDFFCVWARATDSHGAFGFDHMEGNPQDQAPTAKIKVVAPAASMVTPALVYPLYSTIDISSQETSDPEGDMLDPGWRLDQSPPGSSAALKACNGDDRCFTADKPGDYEVTFQVTDRSGAEGTMSLPIRVDMDQPPCIGRTTPDFNVKVPIPFEPYDPNNPTMMQPAINVWTVTDDGDPWPKASTGVAMLSWFVSENGAPWVAYGSDPGGVFRLNYPSGTVLKVRLEVMDRTKSPPSGCSNNDDRCPNVDGAKCYQRVTWNIEIR
jgi:hypothetical protein